MGCDNRSFHETADIDIASTWLYEAARPLTTDEIQNLSSIYGAEVNWGVVRIRKGSFLLIDGDALTIDNLISFDATYYHDDFTSNPIVNDLALLAHETCHVWQFQNKIKDYRWPKALLEHLVYGADVYSYEPDTSKKFTEYRFEQQGKMVQDYVFYSATQDSRAKILATIIFSVIGQPRDK